MVGRLSRQSFAYGRAVFIRRSRYILMGTQNRIKDLFGRPKVSIASNNGISRACFIFGKHCALENLFASTIRLDYRVCYWNLIRRSVFNHFVKIGALVAT